MVADPAAAPAAGRCPARAGRPEHRAGRPPALEQVFDSGSLYALRAAVAAHAAEAGLTAAPGLRRRGRRARVGRQRGTPRRRARAAAAVGGRPVLYCEVRDDGPARPPGPGGRIRGRGAVAHRARPRAVADRPGRRPGQRAPRPRRDHRHGQLHDRVPRAAIRARHARPGRVVLALTRHRSLRISRQLARGGRPARRPAPVQDKPGHTRRDNAASLVAAAAAAGAVRVPFAARPAN